MQYIDSEKSESFMLPENIDALAEQYLRKELGLTKEQSQDAESNLIGFFDVLLRIDERLKTKPV